MNRIANPLGRTAGRLWPTTIALATVVTAAMLAPLSYSARASAVVWHRWNDDESGEAHMGAIVIGAVVLGAAALAVFNIISGWVTSEAGNLPSTGD